MTKEDPTPTTDFPAPTPPSKSNISLAQTLCKSLLNLETREHGSTRTVGWSDKDLIRLQDIHEPLELIVKVPKTESLGTAAASHAIKGCLEEARRAKWVGECGLGPKVLFIDEDSGAFAMEMLDARSLSSGGVLERLPEVMELLRRFHAQSVPEWLAGWDFFEYARRDVELAKKGTYLSREDFEVIERVLDRAERITLPGRMVKACHNDYWSTNLLTDRAGKIWCIDFEVTGKGDPLWDIGYLASELDTSARNVALAYGLVDEQDQLKVVAYCHAAKAWLAAWCGTQSESWLGFLRECMDKVRHADSQIDW